MFEFGLFLALIGGLLGIGLSRASVKKKFPALADYHLDVVAVIVLVIGLVLTAAEHYRSERARRESVGARPDCPILGFQTSKNGALQ